MKHLNTYLLIPNNTVGNTSVEGEVSSEKATKDRFWMIDSCAIIIMTSFQPPFFTYLLLCMKNFFFFFDKSSRGCYSQPHFQLKNLRLKKDKDISQSS